VYSQVSPAIMTVTSLVVSVGSAPRSSGEMASHEGSTILIEKSHVFSSSVKSASSAVVSCSLPVSVCYKFEEKSACDTVSCGLSMSVLSAVVTKLPEMSAKPVTLYVMSVLHDSGEIAMLLRSYVMSSSSFL